MELLEWVNCSAYGEGEMDFGGVLYGIGCGAVQGFDTKTGGRSKGREGGIAEFCISVFGPLGIFRLIPAVERGKR